MAHAVATAPAVGARPGGGGLALVLRTLGELLITAGLLVLLFVAYLLYWTDYLNSRTQTQLHRDLARVWAAPPPTPVTPAVVAATGGIDVPHVPIGTGEAVLWVPRLGRGYHPVVVEGTDELALQKGPGHYVGTALPGQSGNFALAGHRTTYGKPFNRMAELHAGDHVVVETRSAWVTYVVTGETVIPSAPGDGYPITPDPPAVGDQRGSHRLLTLTTCNPEYSASQRLIVRGIWVSTDTKRAGYVPPALRPGVV